MKKLFGFDVTLKELMNLGEASSRVKRLAALFDMLKSYWYDIKDSERAQHRWENIRIGSVDVYLDTDNSLCMKFETRFAFPDGDEFLDLLSQLKSS